MMSVFFIDRPTAEQNETLFQLGKFPLNPHVTVSKDGAKTGELQVDLNEKLQFLTAAKTFNILYSDMTSFTGFAMSINVSDEAAAKTYSARIRNMLEHSIAYDVSHGKFEDVWMINFTPKHYSRTTNHEWYNQAKGMIEWLTH